MCQIINALSAEQWVNIQIYTVKYNTHTHIHTGSHFGADTVIFHACTHSLAVLGHRTFTLASVGIVSGPFASFFSVVCLFVVPEKMSTGSATLYTHISLASLASCPVEDGATFISCMKPNAGLLLDWQEVYALDHNLTNSVSINVFYLLHWFVLS